MTFPNLQELTLLIFQNVYCGHEYTTANLKFGLHVEPENEDIIASLKQAQELRTKSPPVPIVPSTIGKDQVIYFRSVIVGKIIPNTIFTIS